MLVVVISAGLTGCDIALVPPTAADHPSVVRFAQSWGTCPPEFARYNIETCRVLTQSETNVLTSQFLDSDQFRVSSTECAAVWDGFRALLNAGQVYWALPDEALGMNWHIETIGIALDGVAFYDVDGADPYAGLRLYTATHEAAHEYGLQHADDSPRVP